MADKVANVKYQISAPGAEQTLGLFGKLSQAVKEQGKAMEASGTTKLLETLRGGGIAMGITALSRGLTAGLTETRATIQEVLAGQLSMVQASSDFREQLAGSLPIMGDVWRMGRQIRDTFEDWQALLARSGDESSESTLSGKIAKFLGMKPGQASGETLQRIANAQTALQDQAHAAMKNMNMAAGLAETTGFDQMFVKLKQDDDAQTAL